LHHVILNTNIDYVLVDYVNYLVLNLRECSS